MTATIRVKITHDGFGRALTLTREATNLLISESTAAVEGQAKDNLGVMVYDTPPSPDYQRTGHLLNSLGHEMRDDLNGEVFDTADYAIYVHEGTRHMHPRPFLHDALLWEQRRTPARARRIARQLGLLDAGDA